VGMSDNGASSDHVWILAANNSTSMTALIRFNTGTKTFAKFEDLSFPSLDVSSIAFGTRLQLIEVNGMVWVPVPPLNAVFRYNNGDGSFIDQINVGKGPRAIATDGTSSVWVANYDDNSVTKLDFFTGAVLATTPVGVHPSEIVISK